MTLHLSFIICCCSHCATMCQKCLHTCSHAYLMSFSCAYFGTFCCLTTCNPNTLQCSTDVLPQKFDKALDVLGSCRTCTVLPIVNTPVPGFGNINPPTHPPALFMLLKQITKQCYFRARKGTNTVSIFPHVGHFLFRTFMVSSQTVAPHGRWCNTVIGELPDLQSLLGQYQYQYYY